MKLTKMQWQRIGGVVLTALLAIAAVLGWFFPVEAPEARVRERISIDARDDAYMWNSADFYMYSDDHSTQKFHVDGATGALDGESTANFANTVTIQAGGLTISDGDAVVADDLRVTAQTSITVTNAAVFTPTGTYQAITAAGEVTPTLAVTDTAGARYSTGTLLVLINTANVTINLADSGNVKTSGATALGQYDSLTLWFDGTYWIELAQANN